MAVNWLQRFAAGLRMCVCEMLLPMRVSGCLESDGDLTITEMDVSCDENSQQLLL